MLCPFVLQVKTLTANSSKAKYLCQLHLLAGVMTFDTLKNSDEFYTLTGKSAEIDASGGVRPCRCLLTDMRNHLTFHLPPAWSPQDAQAKIRIHGSRRKGVIVQAENVASNGMIHLINKLMDSVPPIVQSDTQVGAHTRDTSSCSWPLRTRTCSPRRRT